MKINGWSILFHPLFDRQRTELLESVKALKSKLTTPDFIKHPQVKLLKAVTVGIEVKIPADPLASYFALRKPLNKYSRMKKMGLPNRYRLFFKVFPQQKTIIILWLGYPRKTSDPAPPKGARECARKEGDKRDCYRVFSKMVESGQFPKDIKDLSENN